MPAAPILFCSHVVELGGAEHVLLDLLAGLDRKRFTPHLAAPGEGPLTEQARALGVVVHDIPIAGRTRLQKLLAAMRSGGVLRQLASQLSCRLLVANSMIAGYAAVRARQPGLAVLWHLHIVTRSRLARWALGKADAVVAPARAALDAAGIGKRGHVVPNGVPERYFAAAGAGLRKQLGIDEQSRLIGIVGRLDPDKGHEILLRAVAALPSGRRPHVVIAGGELFAASQPRLAGHAEELRRIVAHLALTDCVHWLGAVADTAPLLAQLQLLAVPSIAPECAPRTIAEAQAAGCPVIASRIGGVPEMVEHGCTGLLVPPGDVDALCAALAQLLDEPALRAKLARSGRALATENYRLSTFTKRCAEQFDAAMPPPLTASTAPSKG